MGGWLRTLWQRLRAWRQANRAAHLSAPGGPCCSAPDDIYARRSGTAKERGRMS